MKIKYKCCLSKYNFQAYNFTMQKIIKSVYIIGIGGISLSAIAVFLRKVGIKVYGSDICDSDIVQRLIKLGFSIKIGAAEEYVKLADAVIYTSAISIDNKDLLLAKKLGKKMFSRAEVLGLISKKYNTISVAGTHGKTTTTGMISNIFLVANKKPNIHIGGILNNIDSNVLLGDGHDLITEACEYKDSFLQLSSHISVVLNIQPDHLDYFKNLDNIFDSFQKFAQNTRKKGFLIYNFDDLLAKNIVCDCKKISFGLADGSDLIASNIKEYEKGRYSFDVKFHNETIGDIKLPCFGKHNIYNALASIAVGIASKIDFKDIKNGIESFRGIKRRFELIKQNEHQLIIHDYAHHPDEIRAVLETCKQLGYQKLVAVFQPHTYSRIKMLHEDFVKCFSGADEVWLVPIYPAREKKMKGVSSFMLCKDLRKNGQKARYFKNFELCRDTIKNNHDENIVFIIIGAGDIENLAYMLK